MKRELKGFVCGVLAAAVVGACASAAGVWDKIDVLRNNIKVVVNGSEITVDNFLYNDTTYIPLRAVSTALGEKVDYDGETSTAYIGEKPAEQTPPVASADIPDPMYIEVEGKGLVTNDEFQFEVWSESDTTVSRKEVIKKANEIVGSERFCDFGANIAENDHANYPTVIPDIHGSVPVEQYYQVIYPWLKSLQ